jgi:YebC/PmpR family DNA-binding regulatory protein
MSGHSKWSTIKRQKGAADAKRGQLFTKLAREITVAARAGLPDPDSNPRLRLAVQRARSSSMPKDNIDRAIERGSGESGGDNYDELFYEGYGPGGTALMIYALTDNRNRTVGEVRAVMSRAGGTLGEAGSVGWMFDQVGQIIVEVEGDRADELSMAAIDAGASDVIVADSVVEIYTDSSDLHRVQESIAATGYEIENAELIMRPKTMVDLDLDVATKVLRLVDRLEDLDDVQTVYSNLEVSDDLLAEAV